jgi:hypothetical protein
MNTSLRLFSDNYVENITLVPQRKKSKMINELLKKEIEKIKRRKEEKALASAFNEAAQDRERLAVSDEWNILDREEWD